jgi:hypothetical protein
MLNRIDMAVLNLENIWQYADSGNLFLGQFV